MAKPAFSKPPAGRPALGKGLGQLMQGQPAGRRDAVLPSAAPAVDEAGKTIEVEFGRGLNTLVSPAAAAPDKSTATPGKVLLPPWFFFGADLLLLAYTVGICFDAPQPFDAGVVLFCAASISLAALMGIMGVLRSR